MNTSPICPDCGASLAEVKTCQDDFYQMLFWENEYPEFGRVHHLMVLCYNLQHPGLYSPEGLVYGLQLLVDFVENGLTPAAARQRSREQTGADTRRWKVTARPGDRGAYPHPVQWRMRAGDITVAGPQSYLENVPSWARNILADLRASGNLPGASDSRKPTLRRDG